MPTGFSLGLISRGVTGFVLALCGMTAAPAHGVPETPGLPPAQSGTAAPDKARAALQASAVFACADDRLFGRMEGERLCLPAALAPVHGDHRDAAALIALALAYHAPPRIVPAPSPFVAAVGELVSSAVAETVRARDDALPERVADRFQLPPPAGRGSDAPPGWVVDGVARAQVAGICPADLAQMLRRIADDDRLAPALRVEARATRRAMGMFGWAGAGRVAC